MTNDIHMTPTRVLQPVESVKAYSSVLSPIVTLKLKGGVGVLTMLPPLSDNISICKVVTIDKTIELTLLHKLSPCNPLPNLLLILKMSLSRERAMESIPEILVTQGVFATQEEKLWIVHKSVGMLCLLCVAVYLSRLSTRAYLCRRSRLADAARD